MNYGEPNFSGTISENSLSRLESAWESLCMRWTTIMVSVVRLGRIYEARLTLHAKENKTEIIILLFEVGSFILFFQLKMVIMSVSVRSGWQLVKI